MRVLYVCTANICRSASAQQLLQEAVAAVPGLADVEVRSVGTQAMEGARGCTLAPALVGHAEEHRSRPLSPDAVSWADLILTAARDHRPWVLELDPTARSRMFTIRQAGRMSTWLLDTGMVAAARERAEGATGSGDGLRMAAGSQWAARFLEGDPRQDVAALPDDRSGRWRWLVAELDAARAWTVVPFAPGDRPAESGWRRRLGRVGRATGRVDPGEESAGEGLGNAFGQDPAAVAAWHPDDVADPHVVGMGLHLQAYEQIKSSTDELARLLREVAATPVGAGDTTPQPAPRLDEA